MDAAKIKLTKNGEDEFIKYNEQLIKDYFMLND